MSKAVHVCDWLLKVVWSITGFYYKTYAEQVILYEIAPCYTKMEILWGVGVSARAPHSFCVDSKHTLSIPPANTIFIVMFFAQLYFMYLVFKVEYGLQVGVLCLLPQRYTIPMYIHHMVSI